MPTRKGGPRARSRRFDAAEHATYVSPAESREDLTPPIEPAEESVDAPADDVIVADDAVTPQPTDAEVDAAVDAGPTAQADHADATEATAGDTASTDAAAPADTPQPSPLAAPVVPARPPRRNPMFPVGVSLYPLDDESADYHDAYTRDLTSDLSALREANFGLVRLFVPWRLLEPAVGQYDDDVLQHLADLVRAAHERKLQSIVCFFADDRHAELSNVTWGSKRDPRTDAYLLQREISLIAKVVMKLRSDPGVFAWQLGNEAFLSGFENAGDLDEWTMLLREAIRDLDPKRPIGLGLDAETFFRETRIDARAAVDTCEFAVSHVTASYRAYAADGPVTSGPATYLDAFLARLANRGKPVLLDDVGVLTLDTSPAEEAAAMRTALWSALTNRAAGVLARRLRDMTTERREPYFLDPFETLVGLADADGELKPSFAEAQRFVSMAARLDLRALSASPERTAIVMPRERFNPLPDLAQLFDSRACLSAFIAAKQAHVPVAVAHETDDLSGYSVLIVPSAFNLADSTWVRLAAFVQGGGSLLLSYGGGDAHPAIRELFGVEFRGDRGPRDALSCRVAQDDMLGALVSFDARFAVSNYAELAPLGATVVATDATGSPLLTVNAVGQGRAVYMAAPLERAIAQGDPWATPAPVASLVREVYGAVARSAGCGAPVHCDVPELELAHYQGVSEDVLVILNHAPRKVSANLVTDRPVTTLTDVRSMRAVDLRSATFGVNVDANSVLVLQMSYT